MAPRNSTGLAFGGQQTRDSNYDMAILALGGAGGPLDMNATIKHLDVAHDSRIMRQCFRLFRNQVKTGSKSVSTSTIFVKKKLPEQNAYYEFS